MRRLGLALVLLVAAIAAPERAPADKPAPVARPAQTDTPTIPFEKYTLDNGLEVILHQDQSVPLVAVEVWYHVGAGDETPGKSGFAHLFEHMLFQGSLHVGEDRHFDVLKTIGASAVNGTTNTDRTNYFETVPSNQLETALWLESDRMGYLLPLLTQKSLSNQIDVVRNERRQSYDNQPYGPALFAVAHALYPEGHPYRDLTIGKHEDLEHASLEDVRGFYKKWYVPANATLVIAGDFDTANAKALVAKWFATFPKTEKPARQMIAAPTIDPSRQELQDPLAKLRRIEFAWHTPAMYAAGDAELNILASALADSGTGRLYKILVHDKQLAQRVDAYQASQLMSSYFEVQVTARTGADLAEIEKIMDEEIGKVRTAAITQKELDRAVIGEEASFVWGLESLLARAGNLESCNQFFGHPDCIADELGQYRNATPEGVMAVAAKYLDPAHRAVVVTLPAGKEGK